MLKLKKILAVLAFALVLPACGKTSDSGTIVSDAGIVNPYASGTYSPGYGYSYSACPSQYMANGICERPDYDQRGSFLYYGTVSLGVTVAAGDTVVLYGVANPAYVTFSVGGVGVNAQYQYVSGAAAVIFQAPSSGVVVMNTGGSTSFNELYVGTCINSSGYAVECTL